MQRFRFPLAVLVTSVALVALLVIVGGLLVTGAVAAGVGGWHHPGGAAFDLPQELTGLRDVPAAERFAHFRGVQVSLTDKDNRPVTVAATPGTVTAASATSLTLASNDGVSRTFSLDDKTIVRGRASLSQGDRVVVATLNGSQTAFAVVSGDRHGGSFGH